MIVTESQAELQERHRGEDHVKLAGAARESIRFRPKPKVPSSLPLPEGFASMWDNLRVLVHQDKVPHAYQAALAEHELILRFLAECLSSHTWVQDIGHRLDEELTQLVEMTGSSLAIVIKRMQDAMQGQDADAHEQAARFAKAMVNRYWLDSPLFARSFEKPLGYAGDYLLMYRIYRQDDEAPTLLGRILNRFYLALPVVRAGYNRIPFLSRMLHAEILSQQKSEVSMASLACGPAQELMELFAKPMGMCTKVSISLLDQDVDALGFCSDRHQELRSSGGLPDLFELEYLNVAVRLILKESASLQEQIGSYNIFYAVGLFDYLPDHVATRLVTDLLSFLKPGGVLIVGNFTHHDAMTMMDHLADWPLYYRTKETLLGLAGPALQSASGQYEAQIITEETGLMLFMTVRKSDKA
jgi:extracellular factor (EF) 3-hydroxypalmitic acid methyl ester biosynthesis protein